MLFFIFVNLDFKRAALFLCTNPLDIALSILCTAIFKLLHASSLFPALTSFSNFLIAVFMLEVINVLTSAFLAFERIRFLALLIFGIFFTSLFVNKSILSKKREKSKNSQEENTRNNVINYSCFFLYYSTQHKRIHTVIVENFSGLLDCNSIKVSFYPVRLVQRG